MPNRWWILTLLVTLLAGCAEAPVTGRRQLMVVDEAAAISASRQGYTEALEPARKAGRLDPDAVLVARVRRITARLIPPAIAYRPETARWEWQVHVIDEPQTLNAWCMAGGRMAIYTGLIDRLQLTDDEIAQIMGHEISHALARHTAERMSVAVTSQMALQVGGLLLGGESPGNGVALQAAAVAAAVGVQLPNSRAQESEADRIGIELAARGGYDPRAALSLWRKMLAATGKGGRFDFLSTHPAGEKRLERLGGFVPAMLPLYESTEPRPIYRLAP